MNVFLLLTISRDTKIMVGFIDLLRFTYNQMVDRCVVEKYNSRPRDMINNVLQAIQKGTISIDKEKLILILNTTLRMRKLIWNYS